MTSRLWQAVRRVLSALWLALRWTARGYWWLIASMMAYGVLGIMGHDLLSVAALVSGPAWNLFRALWAAFSPMSYEPLLGGPLRRLGWRRHVRRHWKDLACACGLASRVVEDYRIVPRLVRVRARGNTLRIRIRARAGQTLDDLRKAVPAIETSLEAESSTSQRIRPRVLDVVLTMADLLDQPLYATIPEGADPHGVDLGRTQDGSRWRLTLRGRQTLVVGCSGSGKGSVFWGIAGNLAPAVEARLVRLWGIDLKGGIEIGMGDGAFYRVATNEDRAIEALRDLLAVVDRRQREMYGRTRDFEPSPGDPVHVLMIDELAVLTAYASKKVQGEASDLLRRILTQGRALGVVVAAFVQDPRKETVGMRGLFTQTVALRLRSASETSMVLGEGMADVAPAHQISPAHPGTGYVVADDGHVERVRADFWEDTFIRMVADTYPAPDRHELEVASPQVDEAPDSAPVDEENVAPVDVSSGTASTNTGTARPAGNEPAPRPRKPRTPRAARQPAASGACGE
ncbi:FtsK/SpoIIIE domain-containing protein [Isoptericola sp. b515]|uniref:FtsK/SpoIIIE domain-containing protein n=1 Tax=Isoptericola sp. b515 TaxID=3064652 RepID=UPI002714297F|nr:FtsK/SpoIIIE domain-containing protein [Isoptericola sp. b515]MDO8149158.1 FtsK/SpoIIIE domain-containing protein [Isoptericola sp. b515]